MRKLLLLAVMLAPLLAAAQTKKIAHRSHSGAAATFSAAAGDDDFGETPGMRARQRELQDSARRAAAADSFSAREASRRQADPQRKPNARTRKKR